MKKGNIMIKLKSKKKITKIMFLAFIILFVLIFRIGYLQFVNGNYLQELAYEQQLKERAVSAKRGTIYDSTGKYTLAVSSTVFSITINPSNIPNEKKEKTAKELSDLFEQDYEKVLKKIKKRSSIEIIAKKVDEEKADKLREWMLENDIRTGINIDEDTKRYYPYSNLASQFIGFCGSDNQGLDGIEAKYNDILAGKNGTISQTTDASGEKIGENGEVYSSPINGNNIKLSIDMTIQSIVEKYLEEACIDNVCTDGGNIIAMNPKTGDILAMATYPNYNLNEPYTINNKEMQTNWENVNQSEKMSLLQKMWRNKAISDTYEPRLCF